MKSIKESAKQWCVISNKILDILNNICALIMVMKFHTYILLKNPFSYTSTLFNVILFTCILKLS